ncbi:MAG: hypothetical protein P4L72_01540 [Parvibaculum sp.]|uniref:hypothetical protein n=1 Tax=Parvibaculum sp. TaxID=2024848 RepID=UPI0028456A17|nr:hypothetical protein [Parvibaculum sp.]MDR3497889.1 hypothetical protein [Parvibaculum sp.]
MSNVTVYRFSKYDITADMSVVSHRWATREAITEIGGKILEGTAIEVDSAALDAEVVGMTARDFNPNLRTDFQRVVTS